LSILWPVSGSVKAEARHQSAARLEDEHARAALRQPDRRTEAGEARTDDDDVWGPAMSGRAAPQDDARPRGRRNPRAARRGIRTTSENTS